MRAVNLYQLFDKKAQNPLGPMVAAVTPTIIIREIMDEVQNGKGHVAKHPEDFVIYQLGEQDLDTGTVVGFDTPEVVSEVAVLAATIKKE